MKQKFSDIFVLVYISYAASPVVSSSLMSATINATKAVIPSYTANATKSVIPSYTANATKAVTPSYTANATKMVSPSHTTNTIKLPVTSSQMPSSSPPTITAAPLPKDTFSTVKEEPSTTEIMRPTKSVPLPSSTTSISTTSVTTGGNADGHIKLYQHDIWLSTAVNCTQTIYEGYQQDTSYKSLETDVKDGVKEIYKNNANFYSVSVESMQCEYTSRYVSVNLRLTMRTNISYEDAITPLTSGIQNKLLNGLPLRSENIVKSPISWSQYSPTRIKLELDLPNEYFCPERNEFKLHLSKRIILSNGVDVINPSQIVIYSHMCNNKNERFKKAVIEFYVYDEHFMKANQKLTKLAYKVINQFLYDGTTWKLGLVFHKNVKEIAYYDPSYDEDLTEIEKSYIGFGAVAGLLLLIIIVVLFVTCLCPKVYGKKDNDTEPIVGGYRKRKSFNKFEIRDGGYPENKKYQTRDPEEATTIDLTRTNTFSGEVNQNQDNSYQNNGYQDENYQVSLERNGRVDHEKENTNNDADISSAV